MAAGKRKAAASVTTTQAAKKVKKVKDENAAGAKTAEESVTSTTTAPAKRARKKAADFLDDDVEAELVQQKQNSKTLTADGANGVAEHVGNENVTVSTTKKPKKISMMAEAERTQDQELQDEWAPAEDASDDDEEIDSAPALLAGFDSDNDDPAEDKNFDASRVAPLPQFKKTSKKLRQAKQNKSDGPGAVYVGRVPHGFYETQMREYFEQFGTITRLRLSRNKKTGASKHFAFIEFESDEVAKIVAETMDNYLMFGHILKCKYAPSESLHEDVWKGANRKFRRIPHHKLARQKAEQPKSIEQIERKMGKEQLKRKRKQEQMKELGYVYDLPELKKPESNGDVKDGGKLAIEEEVEGTLIPPPHVPKDELATKVEEESLPVKKSKKTKAADKTPAAVETIAQPVQSEAAGRKKAKKLAQEVKPESAKEVLDEHKSIVKKQKLKTEAVPTTKGQQIKGILKKPKKT